MKFLIVLPNGESLNISLKSKELKGKFLISEAFAKLGIKEDCKEYFGLRYSDKDDGGLNWLSSEDNLKSLSYLSTSSSPVSLQLAVRFFPKNPDLIFSTPELRLLFRQYMKNMLINESLGCDVKTHAILDSFIAQAELGDFAFQDKAKYSKYLADLEIHAPTTISCGTSISESGYHNMVMKNHERLRGIRSGQADIMYLSNIQKIPFYGRNIYSVVDKNKDCFFLGFSEEGISFIYEQHLHKYSLPVREEPFTWCDLVYNEVERNTLKLGFFPQGGEFIERKIKVKCKYSIKGAQRLQADLSKYMQLFIDTVDGQNIFDSRKKAKRYHTTRIPKKGNSLRKKFSSMRTSLRSSLRRKEKIGSSSSSSGGGIPDEKQVVRCNSEF